MPLKATRFYESPTGNKVVLQWLRDLDKPIRAAIGEDIRHAQTRWPIGMPLVRKMGKKGKIWEVRTTLADGIARSLFTVVSEEMVILHAFIKKDRKTPKEDLNLAEKRRKEIV